MAEWQINSLNPGAEEPLIVDESGKVWDGNTRILILEQRGVNVNRLPRVLKPKYPGGEFNGRIALDIDSLPKSVQGLFLSRLAHTLTISARSTYEVGTENILEPKVLRAYNELQHRVTSALRDRVLGEEGIPISTILGMMRDFGVRNNRVSEIDWVIHFSFERTMSKTRQI